MTALMLIIALPHSANATSAGYAHIQSDGHNILHSATGAADTLSSHTDEVVIVVPHSRLAWLRVQLPPASHGTRLPHVLHGLLEDRLLDEPTQLHIARPSNAESVARTGGSLLLAVCDKAWLRESLAPLQAAGMTVQRLVPELAPSDTPVLHVMGEPEQSCCVLCHADGVTHLPPHAAQWSAFAGLAPDEAPIQAEPAMVARVQATLQHQPMLQSTAQRWLQASQSTWDLAQGEWAQGRAQHVQRQLQATWQTLRYAPAWRPVRWGLATLLALQLIGLNTLAWRVRSDLDEQQASLQSILKSTFPTVTLIVDAPLQMQREVDVLRQKSGALSHTDFEPLLAALASVLPAGQTPSQIHFNANTLRVQGISPDINATGASSLKTQGLRLHQDGNDTWVLQAEEAP